MNKVFALIFIILTSGCGQKNTNSEETKSIIESKEKLKSKATKVEKKRIPVNFNYGSSQEKFELNRPTVLIVMMDSLEIEQAKKNDGEDNFYTASDDLMWYNAKMTEKMDSLNIDIKYTEKDIIHVRMPGSNKTIVKDSTFSFYTYFYFDGQKLNRTELLELLGE